MFKTIEWYVKYVDLKEVMLMNELKGTNITPDFEVEKSDSLELPYILKTKKYPYTWEDYESSGFSTQPFKPQLKKLIDKMHDAGVIHHDLHGGNIVLDPETGDVRIIDLGESRTIADIPLNNGVMDSYNKCITFDKDILMSKEDYHALQMENY